MSIPIGFFRCKNLAGKLSLGFSCSVCKLVVYRGIQERGIFHCGTFQKPPVRQDRLPLYQLPARGNGMVGNFGALSGVLIGFD